MNNLLREIPPMNSLLEDLPLDDLPGDHSYDFIKENLQSLLEEIRGEILAGDYQEDTISSEMIYDRLAERVYRNSQPTLTNVVNGTGVIIHTNLGRAPLPVSARDQVKQVAKGYANVEYDLQSGERGHRNDHVEEILKKITGAEAVHIVNNNAAAVLLLLNTLAKDRGIVVSRGELVEIGGSFRIPDIMKFSNTTLQEVGTTNKTHPSDYVDRIDETTVAIMKVHHSNYRIIGFTEDVSAKELAEMAHNKGLYMINDLGSGLFIDMEEYGLPYEPTVQEMVQAGCDVVTFSGDKLLGGGQAGILAGKKEIIDRVKKNQLSRALRVDKLTLAAMEATFRLYLDKEKALKEVPVLNMLSQSRDALREKAERLEKMIGHLRLPLDVHLEDVNSRVGGGAYPEVDLPSVALVLTSKTMTAEELEIQLRSYRTPIITRVQNDAVMIDVRTLQPGDENILCEALISSVEE